MIGFITTAQPTAEPRNYSAWSSNIRELEAEANSEWLMAPTRSTGESIMQFLQTYKTAIYVAAGALLFLAILKRR